MEKKTTEKKHRRLPRLTRKDVLLLCGVLCAAGLLLVLGWLTARPGSEAVVTVAREEYGRYPLDQDQRVEIFREGHRNIVEISGGKVRMYSADCPDKLCVKQGLVGREGETIVCLPHQVVVEVRVYE